MAETSGGLSVAFGLGSGGGTGTFGPVTDNGDGTYTAVFTGNIAGTNTITATVNGQPVTTSAPAVTVTPGAVDLAESTVSAMAPALPVGGTTTVTLTTRDSYGNQETTGGLPVGFALDTGVGSFSPVTDNGDGTYSATFTATSPGTGTFETTINNQSLTSLPPGITVVALSLEGSTIAVAPPSVPIASTTTVTLKAIDADGTQETTGGFTVVFELGTGTGAGTFGPVTDNGDGTYTATFSATAVGSNAILATIDGFPIATAAEVTITDGLTVTTNPTSQTVSAGSPVSFVAAASGVPAPTVQWQVSSDGGTTFTDVPGATADTLAFTPTSAESGDLYRAVFTNSAGSATTTVATLTVSSTPSNLVIDAGANAFPNFRLELPQNGYFGYEPTVTLSNGNIVVVGGALNLGQAVFLYNGETAALISTLIGDSSVTALTNGNFVATGNGTATWVNGRTGLSGTVSAANSLVEDANSGSDQVPMVVPLTNGNYVVVFADWDGDTGAVTWGNGTTGTVGTVSADNSLVGSNPGDEVGTLGGSTTGVTPLANGNYVVSSPYWNNQEGAATWGNGTTGVTGTITAANSLIGGGAYGELTVTPLTDGNYLVSNDQWNNGAGAVTWGSGTAGVDGVISASNSLVGSTEGDAVGEHIIALANGNYVVGSRSWNSSAGAVTWGNGATGISGMISAMNSLVGNPGDDVGGGTGGGSGIGGVTALANGNYVVDSPTWNGYQGAVTWADGETGLAGTVSADNSLVGAVVSGVSDQVGSGGVTALAYGNYVVASPAWSNSEGAVTWGNGTTGTVGTVSADNSLVGSISNYNPTGLGDQVGSGGVTSLTNGNYVVVSTSWDGQTGAVTWGNGTTGTVGTISAANSLVGSASTDDVGNRGVTALSDGNYVVDSPTWNNGEGAVTWGSGTKGVRGTISATDSLVGSLSGDGVGGGGENLPYGNFATVGGVTALPNGNYVVVSPLWNQGDGAVTWGDGTTGITGTPTSGNSLINLPGLGGGFGAQGVSVFPDGNYIFWDDPGQGDSGTQTWVDGSAGRTLDGQDTPDAQNSLVGGGTLPDTLPLLPDGSFVIGGYCYLSSPNQLTFAPAGGQTITVSPDFLTRVLDAGTNVTVQASNDIAINSPIDLVPKGSAGSLTLEAGRSILLNAGINTAGGDLSLIANVPSAGGVVSSQRAPGNAAIAMATGVTLVAAPGTLSVDLEQSTDKANNGSGAVTLLGIAASTTTLSSASTLGIILNGTSPGDGITAGTYTQVDATGAINLDGATLQVTDTRSAPAGTRLTIVQSSGGVRGTFKGLPEGAVVVAPYGTQFTISYQGNGGNSVILTSLGNVPLTAQLAFAVPSLAVDEKAGVATVEVVRTGGYQGPVSVVATTSGGTAVAGVNYTPVDLDLSFAAGQDSQTLTIPINAAVALTSAVTVTIVLSSPGGVAVLGSPSTMTLVIQNGNQPPPSSPVTVESVSLTTNKRHKVTGIQIGFSGGLEVSEARRTATYRLATAGKGGSFTAKGARAIKLRSAVYNGASDTVTLTPASPFSLSKPVQLLIYGTGSKALQDGYGRPIDGNGDGQAGSNAVAILTSGGATIDAVSSTVHAIDFLLARGALDRSIRPGRPY